MIDRFDVLHEQPRWLVATRSGHRLRQDNSKSSFKFPSVASFHVDRLAVHVWIIGHCEIKSGTIIFCLRMSVRTKCVDSRRIDERFRVSRANTIDSDTFAFIYGKSFS